MNADRRAAFGTSPFCFFGFKKFPDAGFLDVFQVFDHAHTVARAIAFVYVPNFVARKLRALKAVRRVGFLKKRAVFHPASYARLVFTGIVAPAAGASVFLPQIGHAEGAVHAAHRN